MLSLTTAVICLLPLVAAQSTSTINAFLLNTDPQQLVASVITANPTSTQYLLTCPSSVDANDCGYRPGVTIGQKSGSIWGASLTAPQESFTMSYECTVYTSGAIRSRSAVCTESYGGAAANDPGVVTTTLSGTELQFWPVTITAGLDKLSASATGSGVKASTTGTVKASSSSTGSLVTLSGSGSASKTAASASATKSSSGAGRVGVSHVFGAAVVLALGCTM